MRKRITRGFLTLFAAFLIYPTLVVAQVEERAMGGIGITVFRDSDFRGTSATYTRDMPNLSGTGLDNNISSLRIGPGESWEVCENTNYGGRCVVVSGEESDLDKNNWDNRISSFRKVKGSSPNPPSQNDYVVLYSQINYRGTSTNYKGAVSSLNRTVRSITIGSGTWEFCSGSNFTGRCVTFDRSVANISTANLSRVGSFRPAGSAPVEPPTADWYLVLYSQTNFRGNPVNYKTAQSRITRTTQSITVGKGVWEVCTGYNFTGNCEIIDSSVSNLRTLGGFSNRVRSLRPAERQPR